MKNNELRIRSLKLSDGTEIISFINKKEFTFRPSRIPGRYIISGSIGCTNVPHFYAVVVERPDLGEEKYELIQELNLGPVFAHNKHNISDEELLQILQNRLPQNRLDSENNDIINEQFYYIECKLNDVKHCLDLINRECA